MPTSEPWRRLRPFEERPELEPYSLEAVAGCRKGRLRLLFRLQGPLDQLCLAPASPQPQRRDGLWQSSCFEAFVGVSGNPSYWEINLCPSGHWNVYALSAYRQGLREDLSLERLPCQQLRLEQPDGQMLLEMEVVLALQPLAGVEPEGLELSATAVLEHRELGCSYWAWEHCGEEPDFHRRESFRSLSG